MNVPKEHGNIGFTKFINDLRDVKSHGLRVDFLKASDFPAIRHAMKFSCDVRIQFDLPEGRPPFTPGGSQNEFDLYNRLDDMADLVKGSTTNMRGIAKERMFINMLEMVRAADTEVLLDIKNKDIIKKYDVDAYSISEAWGNFIMFPEELADKRLRGYNPNKGKQL